MDTPIVRAFREWNSANGISLAAWLLLISSAAMCSSCMRMFSMDGYRAHIVDGNCGCCSGNLSKSATIIQGTCKISFVCQPRSKLLMPYVSPAPPRRRQPETSTRTQAVPSSNIIQSLRRARPYAFRHRTCSFGMELTQRCLVHCLAHNLNRSCSLSPLQSRTLI